MWERSAVIYGVDVARYADSDGDGSGDFRGLIGRLDYLADLGVDCLWILPCFPSPLCDNGYDVEDYFRVRPALGRLEDFISLIDAARGRGIRVLLDLVVNHTSDRHPWFQAARRDPRSRYRDYYVWADQPPPTPPGKGTIFPGEEDSVWTFDPVARSYYHHRFYKCEPSLNGADPAVREEIERIIDYWLAFGVAGFRLDAASHLVEGKGLPSTEPKDPHGILRAIFDTLRSRRPDGVLLAEADVPPDELRAFIGEGNQFNLMLNFLLNNYFWLALATESAEPIGRALELLPSWGGRGQWANFLRNLDETDLEQLRADERAQVMRVFAPDPAMRIYGRGIRRRLGPMLDGDPRRLKLAFSLLFALPGAPVIVYGDEIGMGDDLSRPGRDAVRAPMAWSAAPNGGFSRAARERLIAPPLDDGPFSYRRVNVAAQQQDRGSLLWHVRQLSALRKAHPAIATGPWRRLDVRQRTVWAHRVGDASRALVMAHNLAGRPAETEIVLATDAAEARDVLTGECHAVEHGRLRPTLAPYGYLWLSVEPVSR